MTFLHSKGLMHRDLKSNNLLVGDNMKVKVCDFGFSRRVSKDQQMTLCGTDEWMAPEVMCGDKYDEKADVFSFGMVLVELITRKKPPLRKPSNGFKFEVEAFKQQSPADTPQDLIELTILCSAQEPENRPAFRDVLPRLKVLVGDLEIKEKERQLQAAAAPPPEEKSKRSTHKKKTTDETPEERARKREERRKRKEEKAAKLGLTLEQYEKERKKNKKEKEKKKQ